MKGKDIALLGGAALAAYYFLSKKTTAEDTSGGGAGTFISGLTDLSWLKDIMPQNGIPSISFSNLGEPANVGNLGDLFNRFTDLFSGLGLGLNKPTPATSPVKAGQPDQTTPPPTNALEQGTSRSGLTLQSSWGDIGKGIVEAMTPHTANILLVTGGAAGAATLIGGGIAVTKIFGPGAMKVSTAIGERLGQGIMNIGKKSGGSLALLPPGALTPGAYEKGAAEIGQGDIGKGIWQIIFGTEFGAYQHMSILDSLKAQFLGVEPAPPNLGGKYPITDRVMRTGEAPAQKGGYNTTGYTAMSYLSSNKPLGGGNPSAPAVSPGVLTAIAQAGGNPGAYTQVMAQWGGFSAKGGRI